MLEVKVENIIPVTEARDSFNQLVDKIEGSDEMYVLTKNGKPSAILVGVKHLEKLTGTSHEELMKEVEEPIEDQSEVNEPVDSVLDAMPAPAPMAETNVPPVVPADSSSASLTTLGDDGFQNTPDDASPYNNSSTSSIIPPAPTSIDTVNSTTMPSEESFALPSVPIDTGSQGTPPVNPTPPPVNPPAGI